MPPRTSGPTVQELLNEFVSFPLPIRRLFLANALVNVIEMKCDLTAIGGREQLLTNLLPVNQLSAETTNLLYEAIIRLVISHQASSRNAKLYLSWASRFAEQLHQTRPNAQKSKRNSEIVRLRDEDQMAFGRIGKKLPSINPKWVGPDGKPLKYAAVKQAYYRQKNRLSDSAD
jgi:hypothetical protein